MNIKLTAYSNRALWPFPRVVVKALDRIKLDNLVCVHGLSRPYIIEIVHQLGRTGYTESLPGPAVGFCLAPPTEGIVAPMRRA